MTEIFTPAVLITCAGATFGLGYLIINQMALRLMMLIGSGFYLAYYATAADLPLWGAIYTTAAMMVANVIGITALVARRFRLSLPRAHVDIYPHFDVLTPGDFRLVMKHAERLTLTEDTLITEEGAAVSHVYYVVSGTVTVTKRGLTFPLPDGLFVGEVAYLLGRPSVASTHLRAGAEVIRWDLGHLAQTARRNPRFKLAIDAMLSRDLASKVAEAVAQQSAPFAGR
ncbi:Crp/Fnr family transcriptional regulator [Pseudooctadecabacter jejudonensis]|uniref:Cyclic nucleotide-binding domain protein n=1 Tax=Pseudooctadecabacter jejudonensis TaxID=1391910 RepID=A0A1Y5RME0_9RHOB|nr:cyclic nucleotide-binding domain-containing protein [Pseudooctadecabacter jejudonensis]SLN20806.1 Cyclic nucleotide-binding domain protein [Pseudooctadecabacter jejudonensis]